MTPRAKKPEFVMKLMEHAAKEYDTTTEEILSGKNRRNISSARWWVIRKLAEDPRKFSMPTIGRWVGRHHTTVRYALIMGRGAYPAPPRPPEESSPDFERLVVRFE